MSPFIVIFTEGVSLCKSLSSCYLYFLNLSVGCNGYSGWEYTELTNKSNLYVHLETNWMSHTKSSRPLDVFSCHIRVKVGLSPSKKKCFICFSGSTSKMMKNAFYFLLKAFFVLKIFKFLSWISGHLEKTAWLER